MKYTSTIYVVATKHTHYPYGMFTDIGEAAQLANNLAASNPGSTVYAVFSWNNGQDWRGHPTKHEYRGFVIFDADPVMDQKRAEAQKEAEDREWGRLDSERGHANMQTAHNQLENWK